MRNLNEYQMVDIRNNLYDAVCKMCHVDRPTEEQSKRLEIAYAAADFALLLMTEESTRTAKMDSYKTLKRILNKNKDQFIF